MAVFFTFAPIGLLMVSTSAQRRPFRSILVSFVLSGCLAVCWAATFTISRWFVIGIVLLSILTALLFGPLSGSMFGVVGQPSFEGLSPVAAIVMGYILFIVFISGQGRTTLRLKTEMDLAGQIHEALVPAISTCDDRYETLAVSMASSEMGGDLIDMVRGEDGQVEYALAGHRLLHVHAASGEMEKLDSQRMPLGMLPQECSSRRLVMEPGDLLAAYTDGLSETEDASGRQLEDGPIERVILGKARGPLEEIREAVFAPAASHGEQTDDRFLLLVRRVDSGYVAIASPRSA